MVFSILIILLLALVAFFHFVQGFFSATLSAIIAVLAAVLAVSYDETVVNLLLKGKMADTAHAFVLCMIFAVVYIVLRVIFDSAIPGNVRTPSTIDKVGAAVMGLVAGIFVTGIFAIAVQMLPFDPGLSFMGYSRYSLHAERDVVVPSDRQSIDSKIFNEMDDASLAPDKQQHLLLPVDDWVLDTVYHLSSEGSLSGDRSLASVHPDYLQELFGERLGIQTGARRLALHMPSNPTIDISGVYSAPSLPARDGVIKAFRASTYTPLYKDAVKPSADQRILVVRVKAGGGSTDDEDSIFRFSTGSIHIVGKTAEGYQDFYPIGMLENQNTVLLNKPDDFLFVKGDGSFDAVFVVDSALLVTGADADHIAPETFISIKRFAKLDLSGMEVKKTIPADPSVQVIRSSALEKELKSLPPAPTVAPSAVPVHQAEITPPPAMSTPVAETPAPQPVTAAAPQIQSGKDIAPSINATLDNTILASGVNGIGVNTGDASATDSPVAGGTVTFGKSAGAISVAKIDPSAPLTKLRDGTTSLTQFYCPPDRSAVQADVRPYTPGWDWMAQLGTTALIDTNGNKYPPNGCYALAKLGDTQSLFMRYDADHTNFAASAPDAPAAGDVYFVFLIPHDTDLKSLTAGGKTQDLDSTVHVQ